MGFNLKNKECTCLTCHINFLSFKKTTKFCSKECNAKKWEKENKGRIKKTKKKYVKKNEVKIKSYRKDWYQANKEYISEWHHNNYSKNKSTIESRNNLYKKNNPHKKSASEAKYRATKINATPKWLNTEMIQNIKNIYEKCQKVTKQTGIIHHVDHIVPLNSRLVCGLHVSWNLQIITETENLKKGNKIEELTYRI